MISISIQFVTLQKAVVSFVAEDDVIEHLDAKGFTRRLEFAGDFHIVLAGGDIAGGVVVGDDDGGGPVGDRIGKDLPRVNLGLVYQADRNGPGGGHFIGAVQGDAQKMLLFPVGHVANQEKDIGGEGDFETLGPDAGTVKDGYVGYLFHGFFVKGVELGPSELCL